MKIAACAAVWSAATLGAGLSTAQVVLPAAPVGVQVTTEHGIEFSTINIAGNLGYEEGGAPGLGSVAAPFRLSRTEITSSQFLPFMEAFEAFNTGTSWNAPRNRYYISPTWSTGALLPVVAPGYENLPIPVTIGQAMMFCNWLHNGAPAQPLTSAAFLAGSYDLRDLAVGGDGLPRYPAVHSPEARFFLPSLNQWIAASFYDTNRFGPGEGGYWPYVDGRLAPPVVDAGNPSAPVPALPGTGDVYSNPFYDPLPVGSYPNRQNAWGLLDTAGGLREWIENQYSGGSVSRAWAVGTGSTITNALDMPWHSHISNKGPFAYRVDEDWDIGFRIAALVPSPHATAIAVVVTCCAYARRRRM